MKQYIIGILACVLAALAMLFNFVRRPAKIAFAETPILLSEFTEAIKARQEFDEEKKTWEKNLKLLGDSLQAAMDKLKSEYEKSSPDKRCSAYLFMVPIPGKMG